MPQAFLCDAVRTPIGRYGGALARVRADDLAAWPLRALVARNPSIDWTAVEDVFYGCANQAGEDNRNVARMAVLLAGLPVSVPASTVNRLCGSGMDAVAMAARAIRAGDCDLLIAGGVESMSRAPFVMGKASEPFGRDAQLYDTTLGWRFVNPALKAAYGVDTMPETGENVAAQFGVSRADQDSFALRSQERAQAAQQSGRFEREIVAVTVREGKAAPIEVTRDEHPRATTIEKLSKLPTPFRANGTVTAGNASGLNDGACAMIVASERAVSRFGLTPRARVVASATAGVEPRIMGVGPVEAVHKVLARAQVTLDQLAIVELNEAFASQALAVLRQLEIADDDARVNPNGGAIALGHPLGMSGARLVMTASHELALRSERFALCTMCIGVGQGIAMVLERV